MLYNEILYNKKIKILKNVRLHPCAYHWKDRKQIYYCLAAGKNLIKLEKIVFHKFDVEGHMP